VPLENEGTEARHGAFWYKFSIFFCPFRHLALVKSLKIIEAEMRSFNFLGKNIR
jgi:hypothetical protein